MNSLMNEIYSVIIVNTPCLNKNCTNYFCHNFVKFKSVL